MTLVFPDNRGNSASIHALIIGVGGYRHIADGVDPRKQVVKHVGQLGQLTSPPRSAIAFAQHLIAIDASLRAPLGSVEMLISPAPSDPNPFPSGLNCDSAMISNIRRAYGAWRDRCDRNPDNIAMFYFCGHGVEKVEQYLLAEDFGEDPNNPWLGSIAFDSTRNAFHSCSASTQCFFIDACRKVTSGMLQVRPSASPLEIIQEDFTECLYDLTMRAAARNTTAFGPKKAPSYFTQALIKALQGAAAEQSGGKWVIKNTNIAKNINRIMGMNAKAEASLQRCVCVTSLDTDLAFIKGIPSVTLNLSCNPEAARSVVELTCRRAAVPPPPQLRHHGAPWSLDIPAGAYIAEAIFAPGTFSSVQSDEILAGPPIIDYVLEC